MLQHDLSTNAPIPWTILPEKLAFNAAQDQISLLLVRPLTRVLNPSRAILLHLKHALTKSAEIH